MVQKELIERVNETPVAARQQFKFHACLNVSNLEMSLEFYAALFGTTPVKVYDDYAKFEIDEPPLVLSLKPKRACVGGPLNHLGLRVTSQEQFEAIYTRIKAVNARIGREEDIACCYARQTKLWITDPDETLWEVYLFHEDEPDWGEKENIVKLWRAPLQAFGVRGVIRRWWANAFYRDSSTVQTKVMASESAELVSSCQISNQSEAN